MFITNCPPQAETIDQYKDKDGNIVGLKKVSNRYGKGETRHYLEWNGEEVNAINPETFRRWKLEDQLR